MGGSQRLQEMEFELALTSYLEDSYGLRVRAAGDPLDRRRSGYTTLCFGYRYAGRKQSQARVRVEIEGQNRPVYQFEVDLSDLDHVESVVADCESLALGIRAHVEEHGATPGDSGFRRREED